MKLTGKCKEAFEKWFIKYRKENALRLVVKDFYLLPPSMQYGVYVDFFDSVGIWISDSFSNGHIIGSKRGYFCSIFNGRDVTEYTETVSTRHEARTKAIEKADELYNEKGTV
jgi:hypothetical protein